MRSSEKRTIALEPPSEQPHEQSQKQGKQRIVISPNVGTVVVATALVALFVLALVLALAQGKMSLLALGLTEHLFAIVLAVFVLERILTWREEPRWLAAKNWLYLLQLETIDDLLKQLLPATVAQEAAGTGEGSQSTWKPAVSRR